MAIASFPQPRSPLDRFPLSEDELPTDFMLSTGYASPPRSNFQLIIDALIDYANLTGIDLSQNPFAEKLTQCNTPDAVLYLLQERESAFNEYREGNRGLINCLGPAVRVLHAFAGLLSETVNVVSKKESTLCIFHLNYSNSTFPAPLPACKGCLCWHPCPPHCKSPQHRLRPISCV